jgi:acyl dehydratase
VRFGETVTATCKVLEKADAKRRLTLETKVVKHDGTTVIEGTAVVMLPEAGR